MSWYKTAQNIFWDKSFEQFMAKFAAAGFSNNYNAVWTIIETLAQCPKTIFDVPAYDKCIALPHKYQVFVEQHFPTDGTPLAKRISQDNWRLLLLHDVRSSVGQKAVCVQVATWEQLKARYPALANEISPSIHRPDIMQTANEDYDMQKEAQYETTNIEKVRTLKERNQINQKIIDLQGAVEVLEFLADYVVQNPPDAQARVRSIANDKRMSSYPALVKKLKLAGDKARDNYMAFSELCNDVAKELCIRVNKMKEARREFTEETFPKRIEIWKERSQQ